MRDKSMLAAKKHLATMFLSTKIFLSRQKYARRDKTFAAAKLL